MLGRVQPLTATPVNATLLCTVLVLALALWFPLGTLAMTTSFIILLVFALVNTALLSLLRYRCPYAWVGLELCLAMLVAKLLLALT